MKIRSRRFSRRRPRRLSQRPPPGALPGTLMIDPEQPPPSIHMFAYDEQRFLEKSLDATELSIIEPTRELQRVTWIDVVGLGDGQTLRQLGQTFGIHPLALEDVVHTHQRPKVEVYGEMLFIVLRIPHSNPALEMEQISLFVGPGFVVTFQQRQEDCFEPVRERIRSAKGRIRQSTADYLAYTLIDSAVDYYFPAVESYGERLEQLEEEILSTADHHIIGRLMELKRDLLEIRRGVWPLREALSFLSSHSTPLFTDETRLYLRDCYDHVIQIVDLLENHREFASNLVEIHLSMSGQRMNEVMKVLTVIATLFMPLSFITGVYGMNFNTERSPLNMPELDWYWGYPFALFMMGSLAVGLIGYFYKKGWIGRR